MIDLTPLTSSLMGLGPWGIVIGILLTVFGPKLVARIKPYLGVEPSPTKPDQPAPSATPAPSRTPLMDAALQVLSALARRKYSYLGTEEALHLYAGDCAKADEEAAVARAKESASIV